MTTQAPATPDTSAPDPAAQWWGHSKEHGWVVLDRSIEGNEPGPSVLLRFLRCKDGKLVSVPRKEWKLPAYEFAPNYLSRLSKAESEGAASALKELQGRWAEFEPEIQRLCAEEQSKAS